MMNHVMTKRTVIIMKTRDKVELKDRLTYDREEFAAITGTSADMVSQWIHDGMPAFRAKRVYIIEKESALEWLRAKAKRRDGLMRREVRTIDVRKKDDDIFPGIELA